MPSQTWPGFREKTARARQIAWLDWKQDNGRIVVYQGTGSRVILVNTWQDIKNTLFAPDPALELFCNSMLGQAWFYEALHDPEAEVIVPSQIFNKVSQVAGIRVKIGNHTAWIVDIRAWGIPELGRTEAQELAALFELCNVGVRPTPGSLGQAMMRQEWYRSGHASIPRPNNACRLDVLENTTGGRVDYFVHPDQLFLEVHEYDIVSAYSSVATRLPAGSAVCRFTEPLESDGYISWFLRCTVTIAAPSYDTFGVFAVPNEEGIHKYPTEPGQYSVWLWKDEIEACRERGWKVEVQDGWAWRQWSYGLATWAEQMRALRISDSEHISKWIKLATVAGIGRFGMPLYRFKLAVEGTVPLRPGDMVLTDADGETGFVLIRETSIQNNYMSHWFGYILMRCRMVLYHRMMEDRARGITIYMTNYDAIYTDKEVSYYPAVEGITWKHKLLTHVRFPFPRGVVSDQKTTLPGISGEERNSYVENYDQDLS